MRLVGGVHLTSRITLSLVLHIRRFAYIATVNVNGGVTIELF